MCFLMSRSLGSKFSDLEALATSDEFHIISVSKSWVNTESKDFLSKHNLPNYSMFRCKRQNKKGGDVLSYIKANFIFIVDI